MSIERDQGMNLGTTLGSECSPSEPLYVALSESVDRFKAQRTAASNTEFALMQKVA